jgi:hypothetical protein
MCGVCGFYKNRIIPKALQGLDFGDATSALATEHLHDENCGHTHEESHEHSHDHGEPGHVHGEHCDHDHTHDDEPTTVDVVAEDLVAEDAVEATEPTKKSTDKDPEA